MPSVRGMRSCLCCSSCKKPIDKRWAPPYNKNITIDQFCLVHLRPWVIVSKGFFEPEKQSVIGQRSDIKI